MIVSTGTHSKEILGAGRLQTLTREIADRLAAWMCIILRRPICDAALRFLARRRASDRIGTDVATSMISGRHPSAVTVAVRSGRMIGVKDGGMEMGETTRASSIGRATLVSLDI